MDPPTEPGAVNGIRTSRIAGLRQWLNLATDPQILIPAIGILMLVAIWGTTLTFIDGERVAAEHTAAASSRDLAETYEAQVVRALREIDQTLKFVKYAHELKGGNVVLQELKAKALLPPDLLFAVSIADSKGDVMASTRPSEMANVANEDFFLSQRQADILSVGRPRQTRVSGDWKLQFSRRLNAVDGSFAGIVMVSVDAAYFVSGYESSQLGKRGMLGILGTDGEFRAWRSGETVSAGDVVSYAAVVPATNEAQGEGTLTTNPWDGVRRYTSARQLYDFPLAVIVGLSAEEQLAATRGNVLAYLWKGAAASLLLILAVVGLGSMSRQLARTRLLAIEETAAHSERVEYLAYHDSLTTLPNRGLFSKLLTQSIHQAHRYDRQLAVLFLDLDRFKHINDSLGHEAGDLLLKEVATRLRACLRESDTVARLGGDEFVVLIPELQEERYAATVANKILAAVARPFDLFGQEFCVTASIGISIYPHDGLDEQTLTKNADIAMYQAKDDGKNNFKFYSEKLDANPLERITLESGLRHALERNEFQLLYQVKRAIRSGRITGLEALLRWQHPELGMVAPMEFIPLAEETGLIVAIGKWALRHACLQSVAWQHQGLPHLSMAVNLTPRQFFYENLLPDLTTILAETGMQAHLLELEIHESLVMRDVERALPVLTGLKDMGVRIAIDDFGVGYASLSRLTPIPLDAVKIDRSFLRAVPSGVEGTALAEAILAVGKSLSATVVAQGVETKEQAEFLREHTCDEFQGFYLGRPVPADQISDLLRAQPDVADSDTRVAKII